MARVAPLFCWMVIALLTACGSSGGGAGGAGGGATTAATGTAGTTSTGTTGGEGGACKKCGAMLSTADTDPADVCAGHSATLYAAVSTCVCQPSVCGSADAGADNCATECASPGATVTAGCMACDEASGLTACGSQLDACNADT